MTKETHMVKRAIIMAAGIGKRMQPLTFETPKPLVKVNGIRMIDTVVSALHQNGITEIYVVVGHLKNQFYEWASHWPGIEIVENPIMIPATTYHRSMLPGNTWETASSWTAIRLSIILQSFLRPLPSPDTMRSGAKAGRANGSWMWKTEWSSPVPGQAVPMDGSSFPYPDGLQKTGRDCGSIWHTSSNGGIDRYIGTM